VRALSVTSSPVAPVTTGRRADQPARCDTAKGQCDTVDLELAEKRNVRHRRRLESGAAHSSNSSALNTLSGDSMRSRCSAEVKSVAKPAPPTSCVGESGVRTRDARPRARQTAQQLVEVRIGDDRRITQLVTELVFTHLVGQFIANHDERRAEPDQPLLSSPSQAIGGRRQLSPRSPWAG